MRGMRAGMRCAQLREGAGGSGSPATGPSGWRLGRGLAGEGAAARGGATAGGGGRGRGGGRGAGDPAALTPNFDLSFWIRPQPLSAHKLSL